MDKHFCVESFLFFFIAPVRSSNTHMKSMASNSLHETFPVNVVSSIKFEKNKKKPNTFQYRFKFA